MIGFVRGIIHSFGLDYVLIDVNNIGYRINFYHPEALSIGKEIIIYTYQNVREDEISLFGFLSLQEYDLFIKLISVKGLGPKTACSILSKRSTEEIIQAIENGDAEFMKTMPGIGMKTAKQIILDLKGKLVESDNNELNDNKYIEVSEALKQLGYKPLEIRNVIKKLGNEDLPADELVKRALLLLMK